jgi:hypothetical protein
MSSCMPSWQECQEDFPGVLVQNMIRHRRVAQAPVCTLPGFPISTEKFYTVDDRSSHATKSNRTVIVWHLASS